MIKHKQTIEKQIQTIPNFSFTNVYNNKLFTNKNLEKNKATLIIYFNTECEHCEYEIKQISKQNEKFQNFQIVMVSFEDADTLKMFATKYHLNKLANIYLLEDKEIKFDSIFGKSPLPSSFIYNKNGKLVKKFKGEVKTEALLKYLSQQNGN
ncbi:MAG: redoxin domain-containing protein [Bacteroidetes bacterium]|nr:redoxin domain-containing protein [Bacteroidota bacterium]